jgi:hypothetical protein
MACGAWLIASPWILDHQPGSWFVVNDIVSGIAVILLAVLSFFLPTRWAHIAIGVVALWLWGSAYFLEQRPGPPAAQNERTIGVLLLMFCLLPNQASQPPAPWRKRSASNE